MSLYYTGIGSRQTPDQVLLNMELLAIALSKRDYILRSGGADGADSAFEKGAALKEIYLPWTGFNNNPSRLCNPAEWTRKIAEEFHPRWMSLSPAVKKLMMRNVHQVLGPHEDSPHSKFVVCWTPGGQAIGGTSQAIRIAAAYQIPVFNLGSIRFETLQEAVNAVTNV